MYNLEVQEAHTFFVGTQGWLVHNGGKDPEEKPDYRKLSDKEAKKIAKEIGYGGDVHKLKEDYLGKGSKISHYDVYIDKKTGSIHIGDKSGNILMQVVTECFNE